MSNHKSAGARGKLSVSEKPKVEIYHESARALFESLEVEELLSSPSYEFLEGPVFLPEQDVFMFSDVANCKQYIHDLKNGKTSLLRDMKKEQGNGNFLNPATGRVVTCEHRTRGVTSSAITSETKADGSREFSFSSKLLVGKHANRPFNSPNDLVVKSDGTVWFTDPDYGCRSNEHGMAREQAGNFVYRYDPKTKEVVAVVKTLCRPNGLCFNHDESKLYVADSGAQWYEYDEDMPHNIQVFDVIENDSKEKIEKGSKRYLGPGYIFVDDVRPGIPDGIRTDSNNNVYAGVDNGIVIFNSEGNLLARIITPKIAANLCFGGSQRNIMYITATNTVWTLRMALPGRP